jgi:hypothetical protein
VVLHQLLTLVALDADFAGETQVGTVEADELGCDLLGAVQVLDELDGRQVASRR